MTPLAPERQAQTLEQIRRLYADEASVLDEVERTWTLGSTDYMRPPLESFLARAGKEKGAFPARAGKEKVHSKTAPSLRGCRTKPSSKTGSRLVEAHFRRAEPADVARRGTA